MKIELLIAASLAAALTSAWPAAAQRIETTPEQRFFDWTTLPFAPSEYRLRRSALTAQLQRSGGGVLLVPSAEGITSGETFRQQDDFMYLTGLELPRSVLVIDSDRSRTVLFAPRRDARFENPSRRNDFPGRPLADDPALSRESGMDDIRTFDEFASYTARLASEGRRVLMNGRRAGSFPSIDPEPFEQWTPETTLANHLQRAHPPMVIDNAFEQIARVRMVKSEAEITVMRSAARLSASAIMTAARSVTVGVDERSLEAAFESACKRGGSQRLAFSSIIKSGPNALWPWRILAAHYDRRNRTLRDGDLVIFDVGCELDHYSSDVGRTFPASGRFSDEQREILRMSTAVSDAIIAAVQPGVTLADLQQVAVEATPVDHRPYMQTGLFFGHHLGLAVGDPSLGGIALQPGMIFTVEPWYYNHDRSISVFIEDEVLVTPGGAELLTSPLPRTPEDLETLVGGR